MKILFLLLPAFITLMTPGCHEFVKPNTVANIYTSNSKGFLWQGSPSDTLKNDTVTVYGTNSDTRLKIKFYLDPKVTFPYIPTSFDAEYLVFANTSHKQFIYKPDNAVINTLTINDSRDNIQEWLVGKFDIKFKLANPTGNIAFDTIAVNLGSGTFTIKLNK